MGLEQGTRLEVATHCLCCLCLFSASSRWWHFFSRLKFIHNIESKSRAWWLQKLCLLFQSNRELLLLISRRWGKPLILEHEPLPSFDTPAVFFHHCLALLLRFPTTDYFNLIFIVILFFLNRWSTEWGIFKEGFVGVSIMPCGSPYRCFVHISYLK